MQGRTAVYNDDFIDMLFELKSSGMTYKQIAIMVNIKSETVGNLLWRHGFTSREKPKSQNYKNIFELFEENANIAKEKVIEKALKTFKLSEIDIREHYSNWRKDYMSKLTL